MVSATRPRFVLTPKADGHDWQFTLKAVDGSEVLRAADQEPDVVGERLELLSVVRGLEALDQPSEVTVLVTGRYVMRGVLYGLAEWRRQGWIWERYGDWVPVTNSDLWQRLDRALEVHEVAFRKLRIDEPSALAGPNRPAGQVRRGNVRLRTSATFEARPRHPERAWEPEARRPEPRHEPAEAAEVARPGELLRRFVGLFLMGLIPARL